jgi:hypothetical protein
MSKTLSAVFDTRRDAEMTVEHSVQEYGLDRGAISIVSVTAENSVGTQVAGSDLDDGQPKDDAVTQPALSGKLRVSVEVDEPHGNKVLETFATYGGRQG